MRRLLYVPIWHDDWIEGGKKLITYLGEDPELSPIAAYKRELRKYWDGVYRAFQHEKIDRIYQDSVLAGFPSSRSMDAVLRTANDGSLNCVYILHLIRKGAVLTPVEDPGLFKKHVDARMHFNKNPSELASWYDKRCLEERDIGIAEKISSSLQYGETGVLFQGAMHRTADILHQYSDIIVEPVLQPDDSLWLALLHEKILFDNYATFPRLAAPQRSEHPLS